MPKVILQNKAPSGPVWVEARLSNKGTPFLSLPIAPGFPRWIQKEEKVELSLDGYEEVLFRRGLDTFDANTRDHSLSPGLFRIGNPRRLEVVNAFLWEHPRLPAGMAASPHMNYWDIHSHNNAEGTFDQDWMAKRTYQTSKYLVEPFCIEKGYDNFVFQIYLKVTDRKIGRSSERLVIEAHHDEALSLLDKIVVKKDNIILQPRKTLWGSTLAGLYRSRGFEVPVTIPITAFFNENTVS